MKPDRTNYEIWLIDYLDGNLDEVRVKQLISFLEENPDIREECADILSYNLKAEEASFKNKNTLKRSVSDLTDTQFDYLCISAAENDINEQQRRELESIISVKPEKRKIFESFGRIKLVPPVVIYNRKPALRRLTATQKTIRLSLPVLSAAAGIAIMISIFNINPDTDGNTSPVASVNLSVDTVIKDSQSKTIIALNTPRAEKELPKPEREIIIASAEKPDIVLLESFPYQPLTGDSTPVVTASRPADIEKVGFKTDVLLTEGEFTGSLVAINTDYEIPGENQDRPGFNEFIAKAFRERILKSKSPETGSLKAYEVADAGISGINKLLGWDMSLQKTRDENGALKSLYFSSKILKFNAPVKKVEPQP